MTNCRRQRHSSVGLQIVLAACLVSLLGCGDEGGESDVPAITVPTTITLLSDDLSSGSLSNWTIQVPVGQISAFGNPAPSLLLDGLAGSGTVAVAYSNSSFLTTGGLTVSVDVDPGNSNATVDIVDGPNPASINTFASIVGTGVLYSIGGNSMLINYPNDGLYHQFRFKINPYGVVSWSRDGAVQHVGAYSPPATVQLDLRDLAAGATGSRFDNVLVTLP